MAHIHSPLNSIEVFQKYYVLRVTLFHGVKIRTVCTTKIQSLEHRYKTKTRTCFDLPLNKQYNVNVIVSDGNLTLHYAFLAGTSSDPTIASNEDDDDDDNSDSCEPN